MFELKPIYTKPSYNCNTRKKKKDIHDRTESFLKSFESVLPLINKAF